MVEMLTRVEGEHPRISVICRGAGKNMREDKKASCYPEVDVSRQSCAWGDAENSAKWAKNILAQSVNDLNHSVLFQKQPLEVFCKKSCS